MYEKSLRKMFMKWTPLRLKSFIYKNFLQRIKNTENYINAMPKRWSMFSVIKLFTHFFDKVAWWHDFKFTPMLTLIKRFYYYFIIFWGDQLTSLQTVDGKFARRKTCFIQCNIMEKIESGSFSNHKVIKIYIRKY